MSSQWAVTQADTGSATILLQHGFVGPAGASGSGGDLNYTHTQSVAATTWTITHNLGKRPSVTVVDSSGDLCVGSVHYIDANNVQVTFSAAFAGYAYLN